MARELTAQSGSTNPTEGTKSLSFFANRVLVPSSFNLRQEDIPAGQLHQN